MARDATIVLQSLECISQAGGIDDPFGQGQAPYIWPVLVWFDDTGIGGTTLFLGESQLILATGMRPGDAANIPYPIGTLAHRFEDISILRELLLVVLVWVGHGTPSEAAWAGCQAFCSAMPVAVEDNLSALLDPEARPQAIEDIKHSVGDKVRSAIEDALSWELKLLVATGGIRLDAAIGSDFYARSDLTGADFTLSMSDAFGNSYAVHGGLRVNAPVVDLCQAQVDEVTAKQKAVDAINDHIAGLSTQMANASPAAKPYIAAQIAQDNNDLVVANQNLVDARAALKGCRDHWAHIVGSIPEVPGGLISTAPDARPPIISKRPR
jgi:hypothetical protein